MIEILLAALVGLVSLRIVQAHRAHAELVDLLNDFATMVGELLDDRENNEK